MTANPHTDACVMLDARYVGPHTSGIGRYTQNLIDEVLRTDDGLRMALICDPAEPYAGMQNHPNKDRLSFQSYGAEPNSLRTRFVMPSKLDFTGVDLFHSPFNILPGKLSVPATFTLHDIMWLLDANFCTDVLWRKVVTGTFYKQLIPRSVAQAKYLMTVSHASREAIEAYFPQTRGRVFVTYNGVDPFFSPMDRDEAWPLLAKWLERETPFVLVVGQGSPYKNHASALAAFLEAFGDVPEVKFVIVRRLSRGATSELHELMAHPKLKGRVVQLEHVTGDQLRALYSMAFSFLFPSIYEGFGLPALEAMACGTPVITSNFGAMAEVGGEAAVLVDPHNRTSIAEGLRKLWDDRVLWEASQSAGLARAAEFTWARCAQQALEVYRMMLED
ncbi:MAG: glycosyltransferase family 1 protein [bacterium]